MKDYLFTLSFLGLLLFAGAQVTAQVTAQRANMSRGNNDALVLELPSADDKMVGKLWTDYLKDTYSVRTKKVKKTKDEQASLNFSMPGVSAGSKVDMYSRVVDTGQGSEVMVWIATPEGYVSPQLDGSRYIEAEKMLMRFALDVSRAQIELEAEEEEDRLQDLEKELDKLRKEEERAYANIEKARKMITEAEAVIEQGKVDQEAKQLEIEEQARVIERVREKLRDF